MYSPRIKPKQLKKIRFLAKHYNVPMTKIVEYALTHFFIECQETLEEARESGVFDDEDLKFDNHNGKVDLEKLNT